MSQNPLCPQCNQQDSYQDGALWVCPYCAHEWTLSEEGASADGLGERVVRDANGNVLSEGDSVTLIKDLKLKGSSTTLKQGTKVKNIRLVDGDHEVDCKIDGMSIALKACFLKKA